MHDFRISDAMSSCCFIQEIKKPLYGWWQFIVDRQNGGEKVVHKLLDSALSGKQSREENLWNGLVCALVGDRGQKRMMRLIFVVVSQVVLVHIGLD